MFIISGHYPDILGFSSSVTLPLLCYSYNSSDSYRRSLLIVIGVPHEEDSYELHLRELAPGASSSSHVHRL
jgi:hypothetical protein